MVIKANRIRAKSLSERAAIEQKRKKTLLIVSGISEGRLVTAQPKDFHLFDIDPSYQRGETREVVDIVRVLEAGGLVLDPITVCTRPWSNNKATYWIVDGHQRFLAFSEVEKPIQMMVHESESHDAEKRFFLALNSRKNLSGDVIVKSWVGPAGELLRRVSQDSLHPLFDRINFSQQSSRSKIGATSLIVGALHASTGSVFVGSTHVLLTKIDYALENSLQRARVEHYLNLIGHIFPTTSAPGVVLKAIGLAAYERWKTDVFLPPNKVLEALRAVHWRQEVPVLVEKYRPVFIDIVHRHWK